MIEEFLDMMSQEVTIETVGPAIDKWGDQSGAVLSSPLPCRIERTNEIFTLQNGEEIVITAKVILGSTAVAVKPEDVVILDTGERRRVAAVEPVYDEVGLHHYVLRTKADV